ncbi:SDR family NAD(P)-dependent oxidoreductase [Halomonas sp. MCCC 1A17488]|uniref:SDR family NAD(P)-dependent oxidoreductase n=1 Tax=Billgrantia sulfidoxydans TaxID=2733484 RepID=A0ABX7W3G5_9GAMM|nr:SDR family NAD(P)-dependent oxidoreductase [Halomonas sp. MCCC 1A17488]MCG3238869.1 SDR family NAD(P)-dependent oxidoreductase [Halomonas sp. MCCC 1A17488]QPP51170.1 SDR family NAD(P)-dependent oxidoreductase [Halomonas sp. SS10-MC5]QTP54738.1 SDR family NAD(P)-dependent oxidoreductase [Halomonas sulfidoxydans]
MEFTGKVAVVTGAGTGNGEAIAERLHAGGASMVLVSRRLETVQAVSQRVDPQGERVLAPVIRTPSRGWKRCPGAARR